MEQSVNSFNKGLLKDTNPMILGNEVLSDALNATFVTGGQGDELVLQNDMGNRKIEEAYLPTGYVPVGIKEYGGIIYIASYNPITNRGLIGSFPSPERTVLYLDDGEEINFGFDTFLEKGFCFLKELNRIFVIYKDILHVGDKFALLDDGAELWSNPEYKENISNFCNVEDSKVISPKNKQYTLSVGILDLGNNFIDITKSLNRYEVVKENGTTKVKLLLKTNNPIYNFNMGYFIGGLLEVTEDVVLDYRNAVGIAKNGNLYKLKLNSQLCLKVLHNYPLKFNYYITGSAKEDKTELEEITITAILEYNCPDGGIEKEGDFDDIYYNYFTEGLNQVQWFDFKILTKEGNYVLLYPSDEESILEIQRLQEERLNLDPNSENYATLDYSYSQQIAMLTYGLYSNKANSVEISHYTNENNDVIYVAKLTKKFVAVTSYDTEPLPITYNRKNLAEEHILDYFIGVPYNLINQTNTCENPYIRSLSTFGEINIDKLGFEGFKVEKWQFRTYYVSEEERYYTGITYKFFNGLVYKPVTIKLYSVDSERTFTYESKTNSGETITFPLLELGEAYKVEFYEGLKLLKTEVPYWVICTELFNEAANDVGNDYVNPKGSNKEAQIELLKVPIKAIIDSTLEDESSHVVKIGENKFDKNLVVYSDNNTPPVGTLTLNFQGKFDIEIGISKLLIRNENDEDVSDLYPRYIKNIVKNIDFKSTDIIDGFALNEESFIPRVYAGDINTLQANNSIVIPDKLVNITKEFYDSKYHVKGTIDFDYVYKFRYVHISENDSNSSYTLIRTSTVDSFDWANYTSSTLTTLTSSLNGLPYIYITFLDNNYNLLDELPVRNKNNDPIKYLHGSTSTVYYNGFTKVVDRDYVASENYVNLKNNILDIIKDLNLSDDINIIATYILTFSGQTTDYRIDNGSLVNDSNMHIYWMKTRRNSENTIEWVPIKYIFHSSNGGIRNFISQDLEKAIEEINNAGGNIPTNQIPELLVPVKRENKAGTNKYCYAAFGYNLTNLLDRLLGDSKYGYGVWISAPNSEFNFDNIKLNKNLDDKLEIFKEFNIINSSCTIDLLDKFIAPIIIDNVDVKIDKWESPDLGNYFEILDERGNVITDSILINRDHNNYGTFVSTGCYVRVKNNLNLTLYYPLHTRISFIGSDGNIDTSPIVNGDKTNDSDYFGTENDSLTIHTSKGANINIVLNNKQLDLITHLFRYARELKN